MSPQHIVCSDSDLWATSKVGSIYESCYIYIFNDIAIIPNYNAISVLQLGRFLQCKVTRDGYLVPLYLIKS
jgi:hypothetical protein